MKNSTGRLGIVGGVALILAGFGACDSQPLLKAEGTAGAESRGGSGSSVDDEGASGDAVRTGGAPEQSAAGETGTSGGTTQVPSSPVPDGVPEGWVDLAMFDGRFRIWYPPTRDRLPDPVAWEACSRAAEPYDCRQMAVTWDAGDVVPTPGAFGYVDAADKVVLQFRRNLGRGSTFLGGTSVVAEADGRVRQAFWAPSGGELPESGFPEFAFMPSGVGAGRSSWWLAQDPAGSGARGALAGPDDRLAPEVLFEPAVGRGSVGYLGEQHYVETRNDEMLVWRWSGEEVGQLWPQTSQVNGVGWAGTTAYFSVYTDANTGIYLFDEQRGATLLRGNGTGVPSAFGVASDGEWWVWLESEGGPLEQRETWSVMVAPFTADPEALRPRLLRAWAASNLPVGAVVGCGYAAFQHILDVDPTGSTYDYGTLLIRLEDGLSWRLEESPELRWGGPLLVTCDEVFTAADTVRRVRIDSLGEGTTAD